MPDENHDPQKMPSTGTAFKSTRKGVARAGGRLLVTAVFVAASIAAVSLASGELDRRANAGETNAAASKTPVAVRPVTYQNQFTVKRGFVGQVESQRSLDASFELSGKLAEIAVEEGDDVRKGDLLAKLDTALLEAEQERLQASRRAVLAQMEFAEKTVVRNTSLSENGFASVARLDEAMARRDELRARDAELAAELSRVEIQLEKSQLRAPFDGRITARWVDGGESMVPGQAVAQLVAMRTPQVRVGLPLDRTAAQLQAPEIEIDGHRYEASLLTLRPDIDPVTRTRFALFQLHGDTPAAFGQTVRILLEERIEERGLWLPLTALKEGLRGQWTVLVVDDAMIVRSAPVEILHAETERVYVRAALPEGTMLVEAGPQRVTIGQTVSFATGF